MAYDSIICYNESDCCDTCGKSPVTLKKMVGLILKSFCTICGKIHMKEEAKCENASFPVVQGV